MCGGWFSHGHQRNAGRQGPSAMGLLSLIEVISALRSSIADCFGCHLCGPKLYKVGCDRSSFEIICWHCISCKSGPDVGASLEIVAHM